MQSKRPTKGHPPPKEFFALGSKAKSGTESEAKPLSSAIASAQLRKPLPTHGTGSQPFKREAGPLPLGIGPLAKKPRNLTQTFTPLGRPNDSEYRGSPTTQVYLYEEIATEVEAHEFLDAIEEAVAKGDDDHWEALLCGAVKGLKMNRAKPDQLMCLSLVSLAKSRPTLFQREVVIEAFSSLLKRDVASNFKAKGNATVSVLACNVLAASYQDEENWPDSFVKVYLDDSLGERNWVDRSDCRPFVENVVTAFNTKLPTPSMMVFDTTGNKGETPGGKSPPQHLSVFGEDDDSFTFPDKFPKTTATVSTATAATATATTTATEDEFPSALVSPRYNCQYMTIESYVMDIIREQLSRRQPMDGGSKNLVRTMMVVCGYSDVRVLAAHRLEMWLQNPKLTRSAQDLLMSICLNCDQKNSQQDVEVTSLISKIRLKTKSLVNHYLLCIRELLGQNSENLSNLLPQTVFNELQLQSATRNPNNMLLISVMFHQTPEQSTKLLAEIFVDLLKNREDHLKPLRTLLREISRTVKQDLNVGEFTLGLMNERFDAKFRDADPLLKERFLSSAIDLLCLAMLLTVTSSVREAASALARVDVKDLEVLRNFQKQVAFIQRDTVWWLHSVAPKFMTVKPSDCLHGLRKLLFIEKHDHYSKTDNWPPENERSTLLRLISDVPILEDTLIRILLMGLNRDLHLGAPDVIDLTDTIVKRAALLYAEDFPVLKVDRLELIDALLNLCTYRHPENIILPKGYQPPNLAITTLYWKAWTILLVLSAFNPHSFGVKAWENYPTLKCMMEMTMTNNFKFPPPTVAPDEKTAEEIRNRERQMAELVKQQILEFEGHLAAATSKQPITEANSLLVPQLTRMEPEGLALRPPPAVLDHIKSLNHTLHIGHMLCRSRNPDFLLDIIQRQGTSQSMPWLAELVESSDSSLDVLPVQCLCEFLLHDASLENTRDDDDGDKQKKQQKQEQLLNRLRNLLQSSSGDPRAISEVLDYFLKRLNSQQTNTRKQSIKGLSMVLSKSTADGGGGDKESSCVDVKTVTPALTCHRWLLEQLPSLPQFDAIKIQACLALRHACQVETDDVSVSAYIIFLADHTSNLDLHDLDELALDMAQLIVERATLMNHLLPQEDATSECANVVLTSMIGLFYNYLMKAQQPQNEAYSWSNTQDQILLQWRSGKSATMNILVVHAMIILLTYGMPTGSSKFNELLDSWFPENDSPPSAYLIDTSEEALLLPDWLKLRMIRSSIPRLVDAALTDLEPSQLLLFVQSFGIPVISMSKLLHCLDQAVDVDSSEMEQAIVDKGYMAQLIEVQRMRGATGGEKFQKLLLDGSSQPLPPEVEMEEAPVVIQRPRLQSHLPLTGITTSVLQSRSTTTGQLSDLLTKVFDVISQTVDHKDRQDFYRILLKESRNPLRADELFIACIRLLQSPSSSLFVDGLVRHSFLSAGFLRVLYSTSKAKDRSREMAQLLLAALQGKNSNLVGLVSDILSKLTDTTSSSSSLSNRKESESVKPGVSREKAFLSVLNDVNEGHNISNAEQVINACLADILKTGQDKTTVTDTMCKTIKSDPNKNRPSKALGLMVDWFEVLDPEVVTSQLETKLEFIFSKRCVGRSDDKSSSSSDAMMMMSSVDSRQTYMLALMINRGRWANIRLTIDRLLSNLTNVTKFYATAVLDFLWACIHIPRLWQGRDKKLPKNLVMDDVLGLSVPQMEVLIAYIVSETESLGSAASESNKMEERMKLLHNCCCGKRHLLKAVVRYLSKEIESGRDANGVCHRFLMDVYLWAPQLVMKLRTSASLIRDYQTSIQEHTSQLDLVSHRLINVLASAAPGKAAEMRMLNSNIACRKLASDHPLLVLRQLPMISVLLQGRAHYTFGEVKSRNYLLLYTHLLGILELLQPFIFQAPYRTSFRDILKSYFELIMFHGLNNKSLGAIIQKFLHFLQTFINFDQMQATNALHKFIPLLNELSRQYSEMPILGSLLAALTLPIQENAEILLPSSLSSEDGSSSSSQSLSRSIPSWISNQLAPLVQRMKRDSDDADLIEALKELDEVSKRHVEVLENFVEDIRRLMLDGNEIPRNSSYTFMMRLIRHDPNFAKEFKQTMLRSLSSNNLDVVNSALKTLSEFVMLAQDNGPELLEKAFQVGITTKVDTSSYISETLQMLNVDMMT